MRSNGRLPSFATTKVNCAKSVSDIMALLAGAGARSIVQDYDSNQNVMAIGFTLEVLPGMAQHFTLPARVHLVLALLQKYRRSYTKEDAAKVAWRQIFWWVKAQLALIETGMVVAGEVFSPYATDDRGRTLYDLLIESKQKQLSAGKGEPR